MNTNDQTPPTAKPLGPAPGSVFWGSRKIGRAMPDTVDGLSHHRDTVEELLRPGYEVVEITVRAVQNPRLPNDPPVRVQPDCLVSSLHASAPNGCKCADCQMDNEPCPDCYAAWWHKRHPNVHLVGSPYELPSAADQAQLPTAGVDV